jgi:hypothetical protein
MQHNTQTIDTARNDVVGVDEEYKTYSRHNTADGYNCHFTPPNGIGETLLYE